MKKNIKLISLLSLFIISATTFFIFAKRPADDKPETIMVNEYHYGNANIAWVDYGGDKIEKTELKSYRTVEDVQSNLSEVLAIIQKLNSRGYKVISHSEYSAKRDGDVQQCTWILTTK